MGGLDREPWAAGGWEYLGHLVREAMSEKSTTLQASVIPRIPRIPFRRNPLGTRKREAQEGANRTSATSAYIFY
jgi:hypothetical protein